MTNRTSDSGPTGLRPDGDWEALARYLAGESTPGEVEAIRRRLGERPDEAELVARLDRATSRLGPVAAGDIDVEGALAKVKARRAAEPSGADRPDVVPLAPRRIAGRPHARRSRWRVAVPAVAIAAAMLAAAGVATWRETRDGVPDATVAAATFETGLAERDSFRLADGTRVVLAPSSRVVAEAGYGGERRTVRLEGEAFFEVVHDDARPFTVLAGGAAVRDIGTAFTVRARGGDGVAVTVTEGSVMLRAASARESEGVLLRAGDAGTLAPDGRVVARQGAADSAPVGWTREALVFRDAPMSAVAEELRRTYGIALVVDDPAVAARRLSATFQGESAAEVLEVVRVALGVEIERRGDTAVVRAPAGPPGGAPRR